MKRREFLISLAAIPVAVCAPLGGVFDQVDGSHNQSLVFDTRDEYSGYYVGMGQTGDAQEYLNVVIVVGSPGTGSPLTRIVGMLLDGYDVEFDRDGVSIGKYAGLVAASFNRDVCDFPGNVGDTDKSVLMAVMNSPVAGTLIQLKHDPVLFKELPIITLRAI